ncbi:MAG: SCO family protein [Alphaproteobacteria bacterium]|nr:SCO family protein [Alphaproteobacteria bacterium]
MKDKTKWIIALFFVIGTVIGFGIMEYMKKEELAGGVIEMPEDKKSGATGVSMGIPEIDGKFVLLNNNGETVTQDDFKGQYKLIFFGFTFCPAVCPTELGRMAIIMSILGGDSNKVQPLFISIDPERDTPEVIGAYVPQFHPRLIGLTGSVEQIEAVKESFKVFAAKAENEMMDEYMMDHSTYMYLMSPDNKLLKLYSTSDGVESIVQDIKGLLAQE